MTPVWITLAASAAASPVAADADRLCQVAQAAVERYAAERGWHADVRCRAAARVTEAAALQAVDPPAGTALRSGPVTWDVRVQVPNTAAYVQRVPLTVSWTAPAWVSLRNLTLGSQLQAADVELQTRRWPDGLRVNAARSDAPPSGRLRQAVRAGDLVTGDQLLPMDALVRGDRVAAVLAEGAMEIRMPAQLLAAARVGERARAQVAGRPVALEGVLVDAQTLKVDGP